MQGRHLISQTNFTVIGQYGHTRKFTTGTSRKFIWGARQVQLSRQIWGSKIELRPGVMINSEKFVTWERHTPGLRVENPQNYASVFHTIDIKYPQTPEYTTVRWFGPGYLALIKSGHKPVYSARTFTRHRALLRLRPALYIYETH